MRVASVRCKTRERNRGSETVGGGCRMSSEVITGSDIDPVNEKNSSSGQTVRNRRRSSGRMLSVNGLSLIERVTKRSGLRERGEGSLDSTTVMNRRLEVNEIVYGLNVPGGTVSPAAAACA